MKRVLIIYVRVRLGPRRWERTIYGDCNALGQLVTICSHKRWYFPKLIELQILGTENRPLGNVRVNDLEFELVGLGDCLNGCGARVPLPKSILARYALGKIL